jgi:non-ribosomal peptide synthase protein (TIGR01720 family)
MCADKATLKNLAREIGRSYSAAHGHAEPHDEPVQYATASEVLVELLESEETEVGREYWRKQDFSALGALKLPFETRAPRAARHTTRSLNFKMSGELLSHIEGLSDNYRTTPAIFLLACWNILLWRLNGEPEMVIGVLYDGRTHEDLRDALGLFERCLPIRCRLESTLGFDEILEQLTHRTREVSKWQDYFDWEHLGGFEQGAARPTHCPLIFDFDEQPQTYSAADLRMRVSHLRSCTEPFALRLTAHRHDAALTAHDHAPSLWLTLDYDARRLRLRSAARLARQLVALISGVCSDPSAPISHLPLLDSRQRRRLLRRGRGSLPFKAADSAPIAPIDLIPFHDLFSRQAAQTPEAVAAEDEQGQVTYAELDRRSESLARYLRGQGVGTEAVVALYLPRSLRLIESVLGVLKAGGAYLPLDTSSPTERVRMMVEDAGVRVVLSESGAEEAVAGLRESGVRVIGLGCEWESIESELDSKDKDDEVSSSVVRAGSGVSAENLAYVIYTSGSTGRPKGVMVTHGGLSHYLSWALSAYPLAEGSGCSPVHSSPAFDLTVTSLLGSLAAGGRALLLKEGVGVESLVEALRHRADFSVVKLTPSHLEALTASLGADGLKGKARALVIGGEALHEASVEAWRQHASETRLINEYGPTEAVVGCTTYEVQQLTGEVRAEVGEGAAGGGSEVESDEMRVESSEKRDETRDVAIGRAISGASVYVVDESGELVVEGLAGECLVGGRGLARGYLGRAELTAERFVPDEWGGERGARLYRTGDVVRWGERGELEYVGRRDGQVKVRGYRVELGEVEAVLRGQVGVKEAAVAMMGGRLVAYVALDDEGEGASEGKSTGEGVSEDVSKGEDKGGSASTDEGEGASEGEGKSGSKAEGWVERLRAALSERLPEYMVPVGWMRVSKLPLNVNGKIDRARLPEYIEVCGDGVSAPARDDAERLLVGIWQEVLGASSVGIHDNFFELGGDSILAIKVIARANAAGLQLAPGHLFKYQTVAELAAATGAGSHARARQDAVSGALPLTPIQHWFFSECPPEAHHFNQSLMLEVRQALDPSLLEEAVRHLLAHHDALRLRFVRDGEGWRQFSVTEEKVVPFARVDLSALPEGARASEVERVAAEVQASLDISEGPLVRVVLFEAGARSASRLLIVIHHLAVDILSWSFLLEDLHVIYKRLSHGEAVRLPPKTTSYKDWAERLSDYAQSAELRREATHWLSDSFRSGARLPLDDPAAVNTAASARTVSVSLEPDETQVLLREIPKAHQAQMHEALLTALVKAFAWWTGERSLLLYLEGHGREELFADVDVSRTVGWFTAIYPVLLSEMDDSGGPVEALKAVKEQLRRTPNGGLGYGLLRYLCEEAGHRERLAAMPRAQVLFNYQGQARQPRGDVSLFAVAKESSGPDTSPQGNRRHLLEINAGVSDDRLNVHWTYSANVHRRATIEKLAQRFLEELRALIRECRSGASYTPPEFSQARLDEQQLQKIMAKVKFE